MKNSKKMFILIETILGIMVVITAFVMIQERNEKSLARVSAIVQNSDDSQWATFKYGLKMAAEDTGIELFVVSTDAFLTAEEEKRLIEEEINNGADAVIVQPAYGADTEGMLKKIEKKVPVMLVESAASENQEDSVLPVTEPDNYALGKALAGELLKDYGGNIRGKTLGLISATDRSEASVNREKGFRDGIKGSGVRITWSITGASSEKRETSLNARPKVDVVIAFDDDSLTTAGKTAEENNLHGSPVYGIGSSTEAVYYLDTGVTECLIVPDGFNTGYESLTEVAEGLQRSFYKLRDRTVSYTVLRRENLFSEENQELLFTMSQ